MAKKTKAMRLARPARASVTANRRDSLRTRLLELCHLAEASAKLLRKLELDGDDAIEKFQEAARGMEDAGYYVQAIGDALETRQKLEKACDTLTHLAIEDGKDGMAPGLGKIMVAEGRRRLASVA